MLKAIQEALETQNQEKLAALLEKIKKKSAEDQLKLLNEAITTTPQIPFEVILLLLENQINFQWVPQYVETPVHAAVKTCRPDIVQLLISYGASVQKEANLVSPLSMCFQRVYKPEYLKNKSQYEEMLNILLNANADIDEILNTPGLTNFIWNLDEIPTCFDFTRDMQNKLRELKEYEVLQFIRDSSLFNLLKQAIIKRDREKVILLLEHGAGLIEEVLWELSCAEETAILHAMKHNRIDMAQLLYKYNPAAFLKAKDKLLSGVAKDMVKNMDEVILLLSMGADIDYQEGKEEKEKEEEKEKRHVNPLVVAKEKNLQPVLKLAAVMPHITKGFIQPVIDMIENHYINKTGDYLFLDKKEFNEIMDSVIEIASRLLFTAAKANLDLAREKYSLYFEDGALKTPDQELLELIAGGLRKQVLIHKYCGQNDDVNSQSWVVQERDDFSQALLCKPYVDLCLDLLKSQDKLPKRDEKETKELFEQEQKRSSEEKQSTETKALSEQEQKELLEGQRLEKLWEKYPFSYKILSIIQSYMPHTTLCDPLPLPMMDMVIPEYTEKEIKSRSERLLMDRLKWIAPLVAQMHIDSKSSIKSPAMQSVEERIRKSLEKTTEAYQLDLAIQWSQESLQEAQKRKEEAAAQENTSGKGKEDAENDKALLASYQKFSELYKSANMNATEEDELNKALLMSRSQHDGLGAPINIGQSAFADAGDTKSKAEAKEEAKAEAETPAKEKEDKVSAEKKLQSELPHKESPKEKAEAKERLRYKEELKNRLEKQDGGRDFKAQYSEQHSRTEANKKMEEEIEAFLLDPNDFLNRTSEEDEWYLTGLRAAIREIGEALIDKDGVSKRASPSC